MFLRTSLVAVSTAISLLLAPCAGKAAAVAPAGPVLGPAFSYLLEGTPAAPGYTGPDPVLFVALNPQPLPPGAPAPHISLDLSNPSEPIYVNPVLSPSGEYSVVFGIGNTSCGYDYGAPISEVLGIFVFTPPDPCIPLELDVDLIGPAGPVSSGDLVALNPQPLPPRTFSLAGLNFVQAAPDPMMSFELFFIPLDGLPIPFNFSPIPEPAGLSILGLGLAALLASRAGRSRAVR